MDGLLIWSSHSSDSLWIVENVSSVKGNLGFPSQCIPSSFAAVPSTGMTVLPLLMGVKTWTLPLSSRGLAQGRAIRVHPWVKLSQSDSLFEWKAQKEGPVGGGRWELRSLRRLGYWDNNMNANSVASEDDGTNKLEMSEWPWITKTFGFLVPGSHDTCPTIPWHCWYPFNNPPPLGLVGEGFCSLQSKELLLKHIHGF